MQVNVKENMRHVLCICNDKHAGKCLFRDGGGRYPSQTAVKSQPPGNTRTSPRTNLQCKRECRQSLYGSDPKVGVGECACQHVSDGCTVLNTHEAQLLTNIHQAML